MLQGVGGGIGMCFYNVPVVSKSLHSVLRYNELQSVIFRDDFNVILSSTTIEPNISMSEEQFVAENEVWALQYFSLFIF